MFTVSKSLLEFILIIGSLIIMMTSGAFAFATIRAQLAITKIELRISTNQLEFARKVQQNIDNNKVEIGALKCEIRDIKGTLKRDKDFKERQGFPEENIPSNTDF